MPPEDPQLRICIGSRYEHIELVHVVMDDAMARLGLDEDARHWLGLAIREAVANAIKHGNQQDKEKEVEVELALDGEEAVIRVGDHGEGFEPQEVDDPLDPQNLLKTSGRGILFMKSFVDQIDYSFRPGGGTIVTLRKSLVPAPADSDQGE